MSELQNIIVTMARRYRHTPNNIRSPPTFQTSDVINNWKIGGNPSSADRLLKLKAVGNGYIFYVAITTYPHDSNFYYKIICQAPLDDPLFCSDDIHDTYLLTGYRDEWLSVSFLKELISF